ncbi:hypothetical protein [Terrihabitans rhizophilus]|jgi:hypothetical protein|uniref:Uncharacterized protein n=1 Tax=Terrihabitans rhizophilus TaxID=3092662 RepID=A0ABU4RKH1_9HYPH|nr:hypothetical protein [Terrihabitans sp. PJ23]MDX6805076.1 hypothetical protein [Terrihabitans sp. PJ23]
MPKIKLTNIVGVQVQSKDETFSILGRDGAGREVVVELPLSAARKLAAETRRIAMVRPKTPNPVPQVPGQTGEVVPLDIRTAAVGTLTPPAGPAVAIVFDQGEETELAFRLPAAGALELGHLLVKEGEKLKR